jgi:hypothetical protein
MGNIAHPTLRPPRERAFAQHPPGISATSMAAETGPIPGMDRRSFVLMAKLASCAMVRSIRRSRPSTWVSSRVLGFASIASSPAGTSCLARAAICADHRLRMSTICALGVVRALRIRSFPLGRLRPASGRNSMNLAKSSAQMRSVLARVPRERAKALICAGGICAVLTAAAIGVVQSAHSWPPVAPKPTLTAPGISRIAAISLLEDVGRSQDARR